MPLFRPRARDDEQADPTAAPEEAVTGPAGTPGAAVGKGRPTPKRREAQRRRRALAQAPATRREAYRARRSQIKEERRDARRALVSGDERKLPPRDAGPVRRYVRDLVDARRSVGSYFLPAAIVLIAGSFVRVPAVQSAISLVYVVLLGGILVDSALLARQVHRAVTERFGAKEATGVRMYAVTRALQFRRLRTPPPKVAPGQRVD